MICNNRTFPVHISVIPPIFPNIAYGQFKIIRGVFCGISAKKCEFVRRKGVDKAFPNGYNLPNNRKSTQNKPTIKMSSPESESSRELQAVELRQTSPCEWTYEGGRTLIYAEICISK